MKEIKGEKIQMWSSKVIRWSGLVLLLGGLSILIAEIIHPEEITTSSVQTANWVVGHWFALIGWMLLLFGVVGLYARQVNRAGIL